jgi:hypothetical protein
MIANLGNLFGPDIIIASLVTLALPVVGVILLVRYLTKAKASTTGQQTSHSTSERLQRLEALKEQKLISPAEYDKQRASIISQV